MRTQFFLGRENACAFAVALALLALSFFFQPAAFAVVVLFAFAVPGWLLLKALRIELPLAARLPAIVLTSVLVSTQTVYWLSLAVGYSFTSIFAAFAALSLLVFFVPSKELARLHSAEAWRERWGEARRDSAAFAGGLVVFLVFFAVLSSSLWVVAPDGSLIVGGWNYSDFFLHKGIIESVNAGNFPPQEPTFAGVGIAYHWFSDLHTAFLSKASGVNAELFARFETALYGALLFLGVYALAAAFFEKKEWCKRAAFLAAVFFVFGGSFAYLQLFDASAAVPVDASFLEFVKNKGPFDNDWKFFQVPSLIPGYLLVQRPQAVGLPVLALVLLLALFAAGGNDKNSDRKRLALAGLLCGLAAPFQFYAFAAAAIGVTLWFALKFYNTRSAVVCREYAFFFIPCAVAAAPFVFSAFARAGGAGLVRFAPFWVAPQDAFGFVSFYAANLGLVFILALAAIAFFALKPKENFGGESVVFLAAFALALFSIPNIVSLSGTQWDMAKFFTFLQMACALLAAALIARFPRPAIALLVAAAVVTPVLSLYWYGASDWRGLSGGEREAGEWVATRTPQLSVFLAAPVHNSAIESVGGRLRIDGYSSWMNNYGLPYQEREKDLRSAYCGAAEDAAGVAEKYGARFVWLGGGERGAYEGCAFAFASSEGGVLFERVYDSGGVQIYELRD